MRRVMDWASQNGCLVGFVPLDAMVAARDAVLSVRSSLDPVLFEKMLAPFEKVKFEWDWQPSVVIVVACRRPAHIIRFNTESGPTDVLVPPTYVDYRKISRRLAAGLREILGAECRIEPVWVPLKSLAARAGLVEYGRNNVTYSSEFGSYQQLAAFMTDVRLEPAGGGSGEDGSRSFAQSALSLPIHEPVLMEDCKDCDKCLRVCLTGAIGSDRFLLHSAKCLTALNEFPGEWPEWVDPKSHNALVGCMKCQAVCPRNKGLLQVQKLDEEFTVEETETLLAGESSAEPSKWQALEKKLEEVGLPGYEEFAGKNLRALIDAWKL